MESYRIHYSDELSHHGILGMHWGDRNGPPYPLDSGDHSSSEKKAGWKQSLDGQDDSNKSRKNSSNVIKKSTKSAISEKTVNEHRKGLEEYYRSKGDSKKADEIKNLSDEEMAARAKRIETTKKVLLGVGVTAGLGVGIAVAAKYGAFDDLISGKYGKLFDAIDDEVLDKTAADAIKKAQTQAFDDVAYTLEQGSIIHRMESARGLDISKSDKIAYIAHNADDVYKYKYMLKDWSGTGERFDTTYRLSKSVSVADRVAIYKAIDKLWEDPSYKKELEKSIGDCYIYAFKRAGKVDESDIRRQVKELVAAFDDSSYGKAKRRNETIYAMVAKGKDSEMLRDELVRLGYDAMEDLFDKGSFTEQPVIWLNTSILTKIGEEAVKYGF